MCVLTDILPIGIAWLDYMYLIEMLLIIPPISTSVAPAIFFFYFSFSVPSLPVACWLKLFPKVCSMPKFWENQSKGRRPHLLSTRTDNRNFLNSCRALVYIWNAYPHFCFRNPLACLWIVIWSVYGLKLKAFTERFQSGWKSLLWYALNQCHCTALASAPASTC